MDYSPFFVQKLVSIVKFGIYAFVLGIADPKLNNISKDKTNIC